MTSVSSSRPRCLEVGQEGGDGLVGLAGELAVVAGDVDVAVPAPLVLHAAAVDLHEAHAALDHAAGHEALLGEVGAARVVEAVEVLHLARLAADVERLGGGHLHAVGQLERLDAGGQLGLGLAARLVVAG